LQKEKFIGMDEPPGKVLRFSSFGYALGRTLAEEVRDALLDLLLSEDSVHLWKILLFLGYGLFKIFIILYLNSFRILNVGFAILLDLCLGLGLSSEGESLQFLLILHCQKVESKFVEVLHWDEYNVLRPELHVQHYESVRQDGKRHRRELDEDIRVTGSLHLHCGFLDQTNHHWVVQAEYGSQIFVPVPYGSHNTLKEESYD